MPNMTQHLPQRFGRMSLWQRLCAVFNLNDPQWGRPGDQQDKQDTRGSSSQGGGNGDEPDRDDDRDDRKNDDRQDKPPSKDNREQPKGPPDLEDAWREISDKLGGLFGSNNNSSGQNRNRGDNGWGGAGNSGSNHNRSNRPSVNISGKGAGAGASLILALLIGGWLASGFYTVQEGQEAVVLTFGRSGSTNDVMKAGLHWRWPTPIQTHEIVDQAQVRTINIGNSTVSNITGLTNASMLTQDKNILDIRFTVQYRINNSQAYLFNNAQLEDAVALAAESAVREVVGSTKMEAAIVRKTNVGMDEAAVAAASPNAEASTDLAESDILPSVVGNTDVSEVLAVLTAAQADQQQGLQSLAVPIRDSIQNQLTTLNTGIEIMNVNILDVQVPDKVKPAFDDARSATAERESLINEGRAYANQRVASAVGVVARISQDAQAYASSVVAQANGDAQRFIQIYEQYRLAPRVTRDRMYIDAMQEIFGNVTKVLVDAQNNNLLYVPLDRILTQGLDAAEPTSSSVVSGQTSGGSSDTSGTTMSVTNSAAGHIGNTQNTGSSSSTSSRRTRESFARGNF